MWRAIRRTDGKVLFEHRRKDRVHAFIRQNNWLFFIEMDFVQPIGPAPTLRYYG